MYNNKIFLMPDRPSFPLSNLDRSRQRGEIPVSEPPQNRGPDNPPYPAPHAWQAANRWPSMAA